MNGAGNPAHRARGSLIEGGIGRGVVRGLIIPAQGGGRGGAELLAGGGGVLQALPGGPAAGAHRREGERHVVQAQLLRAASDQQEAHTEATLSQVSSQKA